MPFSLGITDFTPALVDEYLSLGFSYARAVCGWGGEESLSSIATDVGNIRSAGLKPIIDLRCDLSQLSAPTILPMVILMTTDADDKQAIEEIYKIGFVPVTGQIGTGAGEIEIEGAAPPWMMRGVDLSLLNSQIEPIFKAEKQPALLLRMNKSGTPKALYNVCVFDSMDEEFLAYCLSVMERLGEQCQTYEIWGEPQCPLLTGGRIPPIRLAAWLHFLKQRAPKNIRLLNGGLGIGPWKDVELQQMMSAGTIYAIDAMNLHPFSFQGDAQVQAKLMDWMMASVKYLAKKHGKPGLPIAITEWGYPSSVAVNEASLLTSNSMPTKIWPATEQEQADIIDQSLRVFHDYKVDPVCMITRDQDMNDDEHAELKNFWGAHCGIWRHDFARKPSYVVVKKWGRVSMQESGLLRVSITKPEIDEGNNGRRRGHHNKKHVRRRR